MKIRKKRTLAEQEQKYGYLFVLPFILGFIILYADMIVSSVVYAFSELVFSGDGFETKFVGLKNFENILTINADFIPAFVSSVTDMLTMIPVVLIFSLFVAVLLNQKIPGRAAFRAIFFIPVILMTGIVTKTDSSELVASVVPAGEMASGMTEGSVFDLSNVSAALSAMSINSDIIDMITGFIDNIYSVVNYSGVQIILLLASLQSISPSIYEAAAVEGATGWETFWKITFPMVGPTLLVCAIYTVIDLMSLSTNPIMMLIQQTSDKDGYGLSAAMAWLFFAVIAVFLAVIALIGKRGMKT